MTSTYRFKNPFEDIVTLNSEINKDVKEWITEQLKKKNLNLHSIIDQIKNFIETDTDKAKIFAYYAVQSIILSDSIKDRMVTPTRNAFNGAIPFKPFFRKQRRMRKIAKIENIPTWVR